MPTLRRKRPVRQRKAPPSNPSTLDSNASTASSVPPFTPQEAIEDPVRCRAQVTAAVWEERFVVPYMKLQYDPNDTPAVTSDGRDWSFWLEQEEMSLYCSFSEGREVARLHSRVKELVMVEGGWAVERTWRAFSLEERSNAVIDALDWASEQFGSIGVAMRWLAPDITVQSMAQSTGIGFLRLLRYVVRSGITFDGKDYHSVVSPEFDRYYGIDRSVSGDGIPFDRASRHYQMKAEIRRNRFIGYFATFMVSVLLDIDSRLPNGLDSISRIAPSEPQLEIPKDEKWSIRSSVQEQVSEDMMKVAIAQISESGARRYSNFTETKTDRDNVIEIWACETCRRAMEQIPAVEEAALLWCSAWQVPSSSLLQTNKKLDRDIVYCSQGCQRIDWEDGHWRVCGKLCTDVDLDFGKVPAPTDPALPTPLFWHLFVKLSPNCPARNAYMFRRPKDFPEEIKHLINFQPRLTFEAKQVREEDNHRINQLLETAMNTRDHNSIRLFVCNSVLASDVPINEDEWRQAVARQVSEEWEVEYNLAYGWLDAEEISKTVEAGKGGNEGTA